MIDDTNLVFQPVRFIEACYNFTPTQHDLLTLIHRQCGKKNKIVSDFKIDLKEYFITKGISIKNLRYSRYKSISDDLMNANVAFKYFSHDKLYTRYNLFDNCTLDRNFILNVTITDNVLPLFYINKLSDKHFKDKKLIKSLFEKSTDKNDFYVGYPPKTYIDFDDVIAKTLFKKLLQYRNKEKHTFNFSKEDLYILLGFMDVREVEEDNLFNLKKQELIPIKYIGREGWKNLRPLLNKALKEIDQKEETKISIKKTKNNYFLTEGRPIRNITIEVTYKKQHLELSTEQKKSFDRIKKYGLSGNQILKIVEKYNYNEINTRLIENVTIVRNSGRRYYANNKSPGLNEIENIQGFIYSYVFGFGKK